MIDNPDKERRSEDRLTKNKAAGLKTIDDDSLKYSRQNCEGKSTTDNYDEGNRTEEEDIKPRSTRQTEKQAKGNTKK